MPVSASLVDSPSPPSSLPFCLYTYEGLWQGCSTCRSAAMEAAPLCSSRGVPQAILSLTLFSSLQGKVGWTTLCGLPRSGSSSSNLETQCRAQWAKWKKSFRVKSSFKRLFSWRSAAEQAKSSTILKALGYIHKVWNIRVHFSLQGICWLCVL